MTEIKDTVKRYLDYCAVEANLAVATVAAYRRDLDQYAEYLQVQGIEQVGGVTPVMVSAFLQTLALLLLRRDDTFGADASLSHTVVEAVVGSRLKRLRAASTAKARGEHAECGAITGLLLCRLVHRSPP